jgi:hypothetical protein
MVNIVFNGKVAASSRIIDANEFIFGHEQAVALSSSSIVTI